MFAFNGDEESFDVMYQYGIEYNGRQLNYLNAYNALEMIKHNESIDKMVKTDYSAKLAYGEKTGTIPQDILNNQLGIAVKPPQPDVNVPITNGDQTRTVGGYKKKGGKKKPKRRFDFL